MKNQNRVKFIKKTEVSEDGKLRNFEGTRTSKDTKSKSDKDLKQSNKKVRITAHSNDPAWWLPTGMKAELVASYPWNTMAGFDISKTAAPDLDASEAPNLAGVMRLHYASSFPYSTGESSALNRASLGLFADILTKNSSNTPFEHTDLMMSIIALSDIDAMIAMGIRAYGLIRQYPVQNKYVAKTLVSACGFNYGDLIKDPYSFVARLNVIIARRNRFYIPKTFNWRKREVWLHSNVYRDSDDPKSQFYVFTKDSYSVWEPRTSSTGTRLAQRNLSSWFGSELTQDQYFDMLESMLQPLENDQDVYIMQGYILKRYDASTFVTMPDLDPSFTLTPVIDYSVLTMIQNTRVYHDQNLDATSDKEFTALEQNGGHFVYQPTYLTNTNNTGNILLSTCYTNPSAADTIEATRNIIPIAEHSVAGFTPGVGLVSEVVPAECNADYVYAVSIYSLKSDGTQITFGYSHNNWGVNIPTIASDATTEYLVTQISYFDFHPILSVQDQADEDANGKFIGYIGDFDNTMILPQEALAKLDGVLTYGIVNIVDILT